MQKKTNAQGVRPCLKAVYCLGLLLLGVNFANASCLDSRGLIPNDSNLSLYSGFYVGGDGCFYDPMGIDVAKVPPALGPSGDTGKRIIFVNGANPKAEREPYFLQLLAQKRDLPAVGVFNPQSKQNPFSTPQNAGVSPVRTLEALTLQSLETHREVLIRAGSSGSTVVAVAIGRTKAQWKERISNRRALNRALRTIKIETFGGVGLIYPNGPRYVHYANLLDPNALKYGVLNPLTLPGKGAVIAVFKDSLPPLEANYEPLSEANYKVLSHHGFGVYNAHQMDFDQLYRFSSKHLPYTVIPLAWLKH